MWLETFSCEDEERSGAVSISDGHLEKKKLSFEFGAVGGRGESSTRPSVELYRGEIGMKTHFCPRNPQVLTQKSPQKLGATSGRIWGVS